MFRPIRRTTRTALFALAAAAALLVTPVGGADATGTVDQQQPTADSSVLVSPGLLQTFTVGRTGRLDAVQITSPLGGPANLQIYRIGATLPGAAQLPANVSIALMPGQPLTVGLGAGIPVTTGDVMGIAVGPVRTTSTLGLAQQTVGTYAGGTLYRVISINSFTDTGADLQFATFVTDPAPTSLALATLRSSKGVPTATLTANGTGSPVVGRTITFALRSSTGATTASCTAVTSTTGTAMCAAKWSMPKRGSMAASFAGDADYAASGATTAS